MSSDSRDQPARKASSSRKRRAARPVVAPSGKRRATTDTLLRRLWFEALNFAESYKLQTLATIFFWMFVVWIVGTHLIWVCEQWLPEDLQAESRYFGREHYFETYWWVINSLMSAGVEGGAEPRSLGAKVVAVIVVIIGLCLVTVLTGNVVAILWERIARRDLMRVKPRIAHVAQYTGHVVVCNASSKFEAILRQIVDRAGTDTKVVLVDPKADQYRTDRRPLFRSTFAVTGNPQSARVLKQADVETALALVVLTPDDPGLSLQERDYQALLAALTAQPMAAANPNLRIILEVNLRHTLQFTRIFNSLESYPLYIEAVCAGDFEERLISQACLTPGLSHFYDLLLTVPPRPERRSTLTQFFDTIFLREVHQEEAAATPADMANDVYSVRLAERFAGRTFREVRDAIEKADGVTVIGYLRWEGDGAGVGLKKPIVTLNPSRIAPATGEPAPIDYRLAGGDELFVLARPEAYAALRAGRLPSGSRPGRSSRPLSQPRGPQPASDADPTPSPGTPGAESKE